MCQDFCHFSGLLHHFVMAKLATSSIRVRQLDESQKIFLSTFLLQEGVQNALFVCRVSVCSAIKTN